MSVHVFVDEVRRSDYMLCAAVVPAGDVANARRIMRELKPGNRRRLHMHSEGAASRRRILAEFVRYGPIDSAHLWVAPIAGRPERAVRDECFRNLVPYVVQLGGERLVVESCSQDAQDARVILEALTSRHAIGRLRFAILPAVAEELLWAADVIAWAWSAGGSARQAVADLVVVHVIK